MTADENRIAMLLAQDKVLRLQVQSALHIIYVYRNPMKYAGDTWEYYLDNVTSINTPVEIIKTFHQLIDYLRCIAPLEYWIECKECP